MINRRKRLGQISVDGGRRATSPAELRDFKLLESEGLAVTEDGERFFPSGDGLARLMKLEGHRGRRDRYSFPRVGVHVEVHPDDRPKVREYAKQLRDARSS